jgi:hypothetical protein
MCKLPICCRSLFWHAVQFWKATETPLNLDTTTTTLFNMENIHVYALTRWFVGQADTFFVRLADWKHSARGRLTGMVATLIEAARRTLLQNPATTSFSLAFSS